MTISMIDLLRQQPFLEGMGDSALSVLSDCAEIRTFKEGEFLTMAKQPAECFFLLLEGHVSIRIQNPQGIIPMETVSAPAAMGWSWLVAPYQWHFDSVAMDATRCILVHTPCVLGKMETDKEFGCEIYKRFIDVIVERLVGSQIQMLDIYAKPGQEI